MEKYIKDGIRDLFEVLSVFLVTWPHLTHTHNHTLTKNKRYLIFDSHLYHFCPLETVILRLQSIQKMGKEGTREIRKVIVAVICVFLVPFLV